MFSGAVVTSKAINLFCLLCSLAVLFKKKKDSGQKSQTNSLTNLFGKEINGCPNIAVDDQTDTDWS